MEDSKKRKARAASVRETDLEPYTALRWVGTIFKAAAIFLLVAILGEMVAGLRIEGSGALPILLGELARTLVIAVVLWGAGDVARLLIDIGHDIRAQRILLARVGYRLRPPGSTEVESPEQAAAADELEGQMAPGPDGQPRA